MRILLILATICTLTACSNAPVTQPDVCYGLQGWAFEDCISRHRGPKGPEIRPNRR